MGGFDFPDFAVGDAVHEVKALAEGGKREGFHVTPESRECEVVPAAVGGVSGVTSHKFTEDGKCHAGALSETDGVEMDGGVVCPNADAYDQAGRIADKPAVHLVLRGAGLTGKGVMETIGGAQPASRAVVDDGGEDVVHDGCFFFWDDLAGVGVGCPVDNIPVLGFDF